MLRLASDADVNGEIIRGLRLIHIVDRDTING